MHLQIPHTRSKKHWLFCYSNLEEMETGGRGVGRRKNGVQTAFCSPWHHTCAHISIYVYLMTFSLFLCKESSIFYKHGSKLRFREAEHSSPKTITLTETSGPQRVVCPYS